MDPRIGLLQLQNWDLKLQLGGIAIQWADGQVAIPDAMELEGDPRGLGTQIADGICNANTVAGPFKDFVTNPVAQGISRGADVYCAGRTAWNGLR